MMSFLSRIFYLIFNRTNLVLLGLISLSLVIWFIGPLISIGTYRPLETVTSRVVVIVLIFALWLVM